MPPFTTLLRFVDRSGVPASADRRQDESCSQRTLQRYLGGYRTFHNQTFSHESLPGPAWALPLSAAVGIAIPEKSDQEPGAIPLVLRTPVGRLNPLLYGHIQ